MAIGITLQNITSKGALTETLHTLQILRLLCSASKHYIKGRPY